ncbi:MAG: ATP-binding protein [Candidatus Krumholzibacteriia bacterium]
MTQPPESPRTDAPPVLIVDSHPQAAGPVGVPGIRVDVSPGPTDALARLQKDDYRLVLVNADSLPGEPADFVRLIRRQHPDTILMVTATRPSTELLARLIRDDVDDFVPGTLDAARLSAVVRAALARGRRGRERGLTGANRQLRVLNQTLRDHVSRLTILYGMGRDISENENWSDALDRFLMALVSYTGADGAALLLLSEGETRLAVRASFQVDPPILSQSCQVLVENWQDNPRSSEIHAVESYREGVFDTCLERSVPWRFTVIPLRHRNRRHGFLFLEKEYRSSVAFMTDYHFLSTIQTVLAGEVANASYISELRQLGRFNQKVLDNIHSGVVTTDLSGDVRFFNERASRMCDALGTRRPLHFNELFSSPNYAGDFYRRVIESEGDERVVEVRYKGKGESEYSARMNITKMHDDNLNGTVLVAIFEDLTERKRLEGQLRRHDRLRVLGQLSAGVAHEIRNPLTGIATSAEVLGGKLRGQEDELKYIRAILDEIGRLDEIIRNLLSFAKPAAPQLGSCALADLSQRVAGLLSDEARRKGIRLAVEDGLKYRRCRADANQLTSVLLNIVLNSIHACETGDEVKIILRNEEPPQAQGRAFASIEVVDSGCGVPEEVRGNLFEPFVTTKTNGTGLGLAISQQIIEDHNGDIRCDFLKRGTRFTIRLPMEAKNDAAGGRPT